MGLGVGILQRRKKQMGNDMESKKETAIAAGVLQRWPPLSRGAHLPHKEYIVSLKKIEYGFAYNVMRSPYTPYSIYLRGTLSQDSSMTCSVATGGGASWKDDHRD